MICLVCHPFETLHIFFVVWYANHTWCLGLFQCCVQQHLAQRINLIRAHVSLLCVSRLLVFIEVKQRRRSSVDQNCHFFVFSFLCFLFFCFRLRCTRFVYLKESGIPRVLQSSLWKTYSYLIIWIYSLNIQNWEKNCGVWICCWRMSGRRSQKCSMP